MLIGGYIAFAILFAGAGSARFVASRMTEISPRDPVGTATQALELPPPGS
jgi:hypothetical protein